MENWNDLVKKAAAERASRGADLTKNSWSEIEAFTAQLEFWKTNLKPRIDIEKMLVLLLTLKKELNLNGDVNIVDREKVTESKTESSYQGTSKFWIRAHSNVAFGAELTLPKAGSIELVASPVFDWTKMAMQQGSGNTSNKFEVHGGFAQGDVSESFGYQFSEIRAKKLVAENIAAMKARGLI